jgi:hypothetical protein
VFVLDTNQLDTLGGPHSPLLAILQRVASAHDTQLAIPDMVLTEHLAHHRRDVGKQLGAIRAALRELDKLDAGADLTLPTVEPSIDRRREEMHERFVVLPAPHGAAQEALEREAFRRRPADVTWDKKGAGARDVVIWLTVLDAMARDDCDGIVFVSADGDFTNSAGDVHPELRDEIIGRGLDPGQLTICRGVPALLEEYAEKVEIPSESDLLDWSKWDIEQTVESVVRHGGLEVVRSWRDNVGDALKVTVEPRETRMRQQGRCYAYRFDAETWVSAPCTWSGEFDLTISASSDAAVTVVHSQPVRFTFSGTLLYGATSEERWYTSVLAKKWFEFDADELTLP